MNLHEVMGRFVRLGNVTVGMGPKHPSGVATEVQEEIDTFLAKYPALRRDQSYVDFLEYYSAAAVDWPNEKLIIEIYGFSDEISLLIAHPDEPLLDEDGFYKFAEIMIKTGRKIVDSFGMEYAFDTTGERRAGVYHRVAPPRVYTETLPYEWYCSTFLEWLEHVVEKQGRLY
jgi:hypothetical protein